MISRLILIGFCVFAAAPCSAGSKVGTGPGGTPSAAQAARQAAQDAEPAVFVPVYSVQGAGGDGAQQVPANTFTQLGKTRTLTCPGPNLCRIEVDAWVSLYQGSTANNGWGVCGFIDDQLVTQPGGGANSFGCPFTGIVPADGSLTASTQISAQTMIQPGPHTVSTKVYVKGGATVGLHITEYRLSSAQRPPQ